MEENRLLPRDGNGFGVSDGRLQWLSEAVIALDGDGDRADGRCEGQWQIPPGGG